MEEKKEREDSSTFKWLSKVYRTEIVWSHSRIFNSSLPGRLFRKTFPHLKSPPPDDVVHVEIVLDAGEGGGPAAGDAHVAHLTHQTSLQQDGCW